MIIEIMISVSITGILIALIYKTIKDSFRVLSFDEYKEEAPHMIVYTTGDIGSPIARFMYCWLCEDWENLD